MRLPLLLLFLVASASAAPKSIDSEIALLTKKTEAPESKAASFVDLGDALMQKSRQTPDLKCLESAKSAYQKALKREEHCLEAMVGMAWFHNTRHEFAEGSEWAEKALAIDPNLRHAHALLADSAIELGDYEAALERCQNTLDLRPDLSSYSRAAHLLWLTGDERKARWLMGKAIAAGSPHAENTAWCRAQLARMSLQSGALLAAEQEAALALKEDPENHHVLNVMAQVKMAKQDIDGAMDLFERSIAQTPNHDALAALVELRLLKGQAAEAEKQTEAVLAFHRSGAAHGHWHPPGYGNAQLAQFLADHDRDLEDALREAQRAHRLFKNIQVTDTLAWCLYKLGRYEEAAKTIRGAMKWNTPDAMMAFHAGMIEAKRGEKTAARKLLYRALSLNPQFHPRFAELASETLKALAEEGAHVVE